MDLITELIKVATDSYTKGDLENTAGSLAQATKMLRATVKLRAKAAEKTSPKT